MQETIMWYRAVSGGFPYMGLFFVSLIFTYIIFEKKRELWFYPNVLMLFIIFNPFAKDVLNSHFIDGTAWRMWWIIPVPFLIAMMFTKVLDYVKGKEKIFLSILICLTIMVSGRFIFNSNNFSLAQNSFRIPQDIIEVSEIIMEDSREHEIKEHNVATVWSVAWRLRMYNPEIKMLYGRRLEPRSGLHSEEIMEIMNSDMPDFYVADTLFREANVSYIVVIREAIYYLPYNWARPEEMGYELIGETEYYLVYRTNH